MSAMKLVELDNSLPAVPVDRMNDRWQPAGRRRRRHGSSDEETEEPPTWWEEKEPSKEYNVEKRNVRVALKETLLEPVDKGLDWSDRELFLKKTDENKQMMKKWTSVVGSDGEVFHDIDWGFFSAILACYNNHWVLRTSPDDWWNVIVRNVAQAVDTHGEKESVKDFFVSHEEKKQITIIVPDRLDNVDYSWLFDQFSLGIRENIKTPGYVDVMQADFSTTTAEQRIASQIMIMSSVQKYFDFSFGTRCGIPGVEMRGTLQDWEDLVSKITKLKRMLQPVMEELGLQKWFTRTSTILDELLKTYKDKPDKKWWQSILSWNIANGSGERSWWDGWMVDFLRPNPEGRATQASDFQSGVVSVPVTVFDNLCSPPVREVGKLVAGTVGFTVDEEGERPVVEANQAWTLLMPTGSPIIPRLTGKH